MSTRVLVAVAFLASIHMASAADITGKITLKGTPPPEKELPLDQTCGKLHTDKPKTRFYVVGGGGELADVFVYLKDGLTGKTFPVPEAPAVLDQVGCEYVPYVSAIQTKQKLTVKNSDPVMHNIHVMPDPKTGNKESNMGQMANGKPLTYAFDNSELMLKFKCDVHNWMFSYVSVVDHPYFSVTGKDGTFKIANVPAGKYTVEVVHRKAGKKTAEVTVGSDSVKSDFVLEVPAQ